MPQPTPTKSFRWATVDETPPEQILRALRRARAQGLRFDEAWKLTMKGQVCDAYASLRSAVEPAQKLPTNLRLAPGRDGRGYRPRCGACRHFAGGACRLTRQPVFGGLLLPKVAWSAKDWMVAIKATRAEWKAAYEGHETAYSRMHGHLVGKLEHAPREPVLPEQRGELVA